MASGSTAGADFSGDSYKIALIGDYGVGKTSILLRLVDGIFKSDYQQTMDIDFRKYRMNMNDRMAELSIWDKPHEEFSRDFTSELCRRAAGVMVVYDFTDRESFNTILSWLKDVHKYTSEEVPVMLIENKCDLKSKGEIPQGAGEELAAKHEVLFKQTSALDGTNIQAAFEDLVRAIRQRDDQRDTITLSKDPTKNKRSCY